MKQLILLLICVTLIGCKKQNRDAKNVDENFEVFIDKFSRDSLFQISRINFPLSVTELNDDFESFEKKIDKKEYRKIDLRYNDSLSSRQLDAYTKKTNLTLNKAIIELRGVDNGIMTDVFFEKRDGKWILVGWNDSST